MDNRQFVNSCDIGNVNAKSKKHGNLFFEKGVLYSYGYHYPLCFVIDNEQYVNSMGYSATTSKHIGMCSGIRVELQNRDVTKENVLQSFIVMKENRQMDLNNCVRDTSMKKTRLQAELEEIEEHIARLS